MRPSAKLWLVAVLGTLPGDGHLEANAKTNIERAKLSARDGARNRAWLIHDARVFVGDGSVLDRASVLVKDGKIDRYLHRRRARREVAATRTSSRPRAKRCCPD